MKVEFIASVAIVIADPGSEPQTVRRCARPALPGVFRSVPPRDGVRVASVAAHAL
jgi:hypothetical protein